MLINICGSELRVLRSVAERKANPRLTFKITNTVVKLIKQKFEPYNSQDVGLEAAIHLKSA